MIGKRECTEEAVSQPSANPKVSALNRPMTTYRKGGTDPVFGLFSVHLHAMISRRAITLPALGSGVY